MASSSGQLVAIETISHRAAADRRIRKARTYLEENFRKTPTAGYLCRITGGTRFSVVRGFRKLYGRTPKQILTDLQIEEAKKLLLEGVNVTEIATRLGLCQQSYLSRIFKRSTGVTPLRWRRDAQHNSIKGKRS